MRSSTPLIVFLYIFSIIILIDIFKTTSLIKDKRSYLALNCPCNLSNWHSPKRHKNNFVTKPGISEICFIWGSPPAWLPWIRLLSWISTNHNWSYKRIWITLDRSNLWFVFSHFWLVWRSIMYLALSNDDYQRHQDFLLKFEEIYFQSLWN